LQKRLDEVIEMILSAIEKRPHPFLFDVIPDIALGLTRRHPSNIREFSEMIEKLSISTFSFFSDQTTLNENPDILTSYLKLMSNVSSKEENLISFYERLFEILTFC